jgi:RNA polymerase sigma-70 factor (ECF subfamily)
MRSLTLDHAPTAGRTATADRLDEAELIGRVRQRDPSAFDELVRRYLRRAFAVAYHVMQHREDAEDLVQDAFITVLEQIDRYDPERPFAPWFFRIVVNRGLNARKSRRVRQTEAVPEGTASAGASPELLAERAELYALLRLAVDELPERHRLIVRLVELEGFSTTEVAQMLDLSPSTVRWYLHEARHRLRGVLAPMHGGVHAV